MPAQPMPNDSYAGDIDSKTAWKLLERTFGALLVDVRTKDEWAAVGQPDVEKSKMLSITFCSYPEMQVNKNFAREMENKVKDKSIPLLFICKGGGRSRAAAELMAARGYRNCYNIYDGYEGGWKNSLPWRATL